MAIPADQVRGKRQLPLKVQAVICDLDGTLIHTGPDLAQAVNLMLRELGRAPYTEDKVYEWIGNGVARLVKRALTGSKDGEPDAAVFDPALDVFRRHYMTVVSDRSRPYPGVIESLPKLQRRGYRLACVTNKAQAFTGRLLRDLAMDQFFEITISGDSLPEKKPSPLPLRHICQQFGIEPARAVLVGDSINDIRAADAAGMPVICVSYGYNQGLDLTKSSPAAMIDSFEQLDALLEYVKQSQ